MLLNFGGYARKEVYGDVLHAMTQKSTSPVYALEIHKTESGKWSWYQKYWESVPALSHNINDFHAKALEEAQDGNTARIVRVVTQDAFNQSEPIRIEYARFYSPKQKA